VAGASRGCGRGIALALASAGATVYCTGRTSRSGPGPSDNAPGTIEDTAAGVDRRGGRGIPVRVDHTDPAQVAGLFDRIQSEQGRLHVAVSAVWGGNERSLDPVWKEPFWRHAPSVWQESLDAGPHAFWLTAQGAARLMEPEGSGLIVAITELTFDQGAGGRHSTMAETFQHLGHYAINRLVRDLARDSRAAGITVVGLLPGFMKTERVEMYLKSLSEEARAQMRYDLAETPEFAGRAVAALAGTPDPSFYSGQLLHVSDLANRFNFTDTDGSRPANFYRALGLIK
ncbi:MAG: SDR family oxidoreductase, partial [Acidobacteria bacterium]|nr:SDR family oxidoreductase [Acidobacteriota bacterium]